MLLDERIKDLVNELDKSRNYARQLATEKKLQEKRYLKLKKRYDNRGSIIRKLQKHIAYIKSHRTDYKTLERRITNLERGANPMG